MSGSASNRRRTPAVTVQSRAERVAPAPAPQEANLWVMRLTPPRAAGGPSQVGKPYENDLDLAGIPRTPSWECLWHCGRVDFASPTLEATRGRLLARFGARVGPWWERLPGAIADLAALGAGRWWRRWARQHLAGGARPSPRCWPPPRPPEVPVPSRSPHSWRSRPKDHNLRLEY